jgi:hypothetical protein
MDLTWSGGGSKTSLKKTKKRPSFIFNNFFTSLALCLDVSDLRSELSKYDYKNLNFPGKMFYCRFCVQSGGLKISLVPIGPNDELRGVTCRRS